VISARPAHAALVSEADFIAAQNIRAPRGNPQPDRCYRLAGLLRCGICGRRMGSCWANNHAAYRCRHESTSAAAPDPTRPKNLYVREDRVLTHLPALYILLTGSDPRLATRRQQRPRSSSHLREREIALIYEPETRTLRTNTPQEVKIIINPTR
jgi:site-specific DNA recombinase